MASLGFNSCQDDNRLHVCDVSTWFQLVCVCVLPVSFCSSKGSTLSRRGCKKTSETSGKGDEGGRGQEAQVPLEDLDRNQKILQWMMEGDRQRKSSHG